MTFSEKILHSDSNTIVVSMGSNRIEDIFFIETEKAIFFELRDR